MYNELKKRTLARVVSFRLCNIFMEPEKKEIKYIAANLLKQIGRVLSILIIHRIRATFFVSIQDIILKGNGLHTCLA